MLSVALLLRHIHREHLYNLAYRHSRVLDELQSLLLSIGHHEALICHVQVGSGVEGFHNPKS
jgi:hypothetical protein